MKTRFLISLGKRSLPARLLALSIISSLLAALTIGLSPAASSDQLGLTVNSRGVLLRNGQPYRGIGVNYYDLFLRCLRNPNDTSYREGLAQLGTHDIPFARFAAGGYHGADFQLYLKDKEAYFRLLDNVVQAAEKSRVGLIASLFWSISAASEAMHEPTTAWGDPQSKTRQFMREYTRNVVSRYHNSPAIWGWEFSCELSLPLDLPRPPANSLRGRERAISYPVFRDATLDFAHVVRSIDSSRILLTGNSMPRPSAYHNTTEGSFKPDTQDQFASILLRDNPGPFNPICVHTSPDRIARYFAGRHVSYPELLDVCVQTGRTAGKAIYLEEFVPTTGKRGMWPPTNERSYFTQELSAIERSAIPLASVWVYDRKLVRDRSNLTFNNDRAYMLQMISDFDRTIHARN